MTAPPAKPPHGSPCNRCGVCCQHELCPVGALFFFNVRPEDGKALVGPCPALTFSFNGLAECGLAVRPGYYRRAASERFGEENMSGAMAHLIGAGGGCDAAIDGEPEDKAFSLRMREEGTSQAGARKALLAMRMWDLI